MASSKRDKEDVEQIGMRHADMALAGPSVLRLGTVRSMIGEVTPDARGHGRGESGRHQTPTSSQLDAHRVSFAHIVAPLTKKMNHGDQPLYPSR